MPHHQVLSVPDCYATIMDEHKGRHQKKVLFWLCGIDDDGEHYFIPYIVWRGELVRAPTDADLEF